MLLSGIELAVGESVRLADHVLTILDIHGDEITFRVDYPDEELFGGLCSESGPMADRPPR